MGFNLISVHNDDVRRTACSRTQTAIAVQLELHEVHNWRLRMMNELSVQFSSKNKRASESLCEHSKAFESIQEHPKPPRAPQSI